MTTSTDVKFWEVRRNLSSAKASYEVRWVVGGREKSRTRRTKGLAETFLSELRQAARRGERFDITTGLPESMLKAASTKTWYAHVVWYVDKRWPGAAAKTRKSMLEALATVTDSPRPPGTILGLPTLLAHFVGLNPRRYRIGALSVPSRARRPPRAGARSGRRHRGPRPGAPATTPVGRGARGRGGRTRLRSRIGWPGQRNSAMDCLTAS